MVKNNENDNTIKQNINESEVTIQIDSQEINNDNKILSSFNDIPKTSSDIENEKKQFNSGNMSVKDNQVENLFTIQSAIINDGISLGNYTVREVLQNSGKVNKEYDLSNAEEFAEFGEAVKAGEYFAIAIILCVFEYVELNDLQNLKSKLLIELPKITDEEGNEIAVYQNPYLSVNSLLKTVKGEMVVLTSGEQCIRLSVNRSKALENLWKQFPEMREYIARWLLNVYDSFKYHTNFNITQITAAFINIFKLDFNAGTVHFFSRFYSKPNNYWLIGLIAVELYNDPIYRDKILPYINKWAESSSSWLWKSAIYVYANIKNGEENCELHKKVQKALTNWYSLLEYDNSCSEDLSYIGMLLISSERLRTLVSSILGNVIDNTYDYNKKRLNCLWYLELLRYGYYYISPKIIALPLVACDNKQQLQNLLPLLNIILSRYDTRQLLFATLESYIKEISEYSINKKIMNHIKAFFQFITDNNQLFRNDIILFLKKCNCNLANELKEFLSKVFLETGSTRFLTKNSNLN